MFKSKNKFDMFLQQEGSCGRQSVGAGRRAGMEVGKLGKARPCRLWRPWK